MAEKKATKKVESPEELEAKVEATAETTLVAEATEKPTEATEADEPKEEKKAAKAGKRSEKAQKEAEEKVAKAERKAKGDTTPQEGSEGKAKQKQNPTRSRLERRGKNYRKVAEQIEAGKLYAFKDALELATKTNVGKFDGTVELHLNLNVDPRQADQNVRSTVYPQAPPGLFFTGDPEFPGNAVMNSKIAQFAPRLGVVWTPCAGPVLASILVLAARAQDPGQSSLLLSAWRSASRPTAARCARGWKPCRST